MREKTTAVQIVMPQHCNGYKKPRLFGGQIMAWIDVVGAVAARRYTGKSVTTVCIDNLTFLKPAYENDTIVQEAIVTWTGRTSLEVRVDSMVERLDGSRELINRPPVVPETEEEKRIFHDAEIRKHMRMSLGDEAKGGK